MPDQEKRTISSTQTAMLQNVSRYGTRWTLMQWFMGNEAPPPDHNRLDLGLELQPFVLRKVAAELAIEVEPNMVNLYRRRNRYGATIDAWTRMPDFGQVVVEVKCVFDFIQWREVWDNGKRPPVETEWQVQTQLYVGDGNEPFRRAIIAVFPVFSGELKIFYRDPVPEAFARMEADAETFFADLAAGNVGSPYGHPSEDDLLGTMFAPKPGKILDLREDPAAQDLACDVVEMHQYADAASGNKKQADILKRRVRLAAGDAEQVLLPHGIVLRMRQQSRKGFTVAPSTFTVLDEFIPAGVAQAIERPALTDTLKDILRGG